MQFLLTLVSLTFSYGAGPGFPPQLPSQAAVSCVNVTKQTFVYIFEISSRKYGVDIPDVQKLSPAQQIEAGTRLDFFMSLPRLFPRSPVEIDRSQLPVKLTFRIPGQLWLDIDVANPQNYLGGVKYVGELTYTTWDTAGSRIVEVDCIQGALGPILSL